MKSSARNSFLAAIAFLVLIATTLAAGCGEEPTVKTAVETAPTATNPAYLRQAPPYFLGIDEPRADAWQDLVIDQERLREDHFNTVTLAPPVLITQRAGGKPRVILEGEAGTVPSLTGELHQAGFSVFIAPTTAITGFNPRVEPTEATMKQLSEDASRWAQAAEEQQAELFSPLAEYNLALGTGAAIKWSAEVLPAVKQKFHGAVVAKVVPDVTVAAVGSEAHDFEKLDYRGYDYLMLDIYPRGDTFDQASFEAEVGDLLSRADAIRERDGLKGVMIEFGAWREPAGTDAVDGPLLGDDTQALMAGRIVQLARPRVKGIFWRGWTLPGRGAKGHRTEEAIQRGFTGLG